MKRRFQFQARAQANMPVLQELQPYVVTGRRLQSVIASDNESTASADVTYPSARLVCTYIACCKKYMRFLVLCYLQYCLIHGG